MDTHGKGTNTLLHIAASFGMLCAVKGEPRPMTTRIHQYTIYRPSSVCKRFRLHLGSLGGRSFNFRLEAP